MIEALKSVREDLHARMARLSICNESTRSIKDAIADVDELMKTARPVDRASLAWSYAHAYKSLRNTGAAETSVELCKNLFEEVLNEERQANCQEDQDAEKTAAEARAIRPLVDRGTASVCRRWFRRLYSLWPIRFLRRS